MTQKIILSADEQIECPECQHKFALSLGIARQTIEKYEQDFNAVIEKRSSEISKQVEKEADKKFEKMYAAKVSSITQELSGSQEELSGLKTKLETVQKETRDKANEEFELEKKLLQQELEDKNSKLVAFRALELEVRQEKNKLAEERSQLNLEFQRKLDEEKKVLELKLRNEVEKETEKKVIGTYSGKITELQELLSGSQQALVNSQKKAEDAQKEIKAKVIAEFELEKKSLQTELSEKTEKLQKLNEQELILRKEKRELEDSQKNIELEVQRKVDEEKKKIEEQTRNSEADRFKLKEAEYQKKIEDAQKSNEDLRRKLEQGSQQLQGEVFELEIESLLKSTFPFDLIEPVRKGARGADVVQTVMTRTGQACGKIIWEAKRAENWSNAWVQKLKDNQQSVNAEVAVLITTSMPKQTKEPFCMVDDIWVVDITSVRPMAETLRIMLMESHKHKLVDLNKNEKMEALYLYLCSPQFAQKIRGVVDAFTTMKRELDSEKAAMAKIWKRRELQIERVTQNMMGMCGELQAIAQNSIPQLEEIGALPAPEEDDQEVGA